MGVECGRDAATGGADGEANAQWHRDGNNRKAATTRRKKKKHTQGPCTLRVVARLGLCMAEGRTCRSVGHEFNPPEAQAGRAPLEAQVLAHPNRRKRFSVFATWDLGIIGRGLISVGMMPSPCVVSVSLGILKRSRACGGLPRLDDKPGGDAAP